MPRRTKPYLLRASLRPDFEPDYDDYPFDIPAVRALANIDFHPNVTLFVGENGLGKSTLLEDHAGLLNNYPRRLDQLLSDGGEV